VAISPPDGVVANNDVGGATKDGGLVSEGNF